MNSKQSKKLMIGTVLMWDNNPKEKGTVREVTHAGVLIDWENPRDGLCWLSHLDAEHINFWHPETTPKGA